MKDDSISRQAATTIPVMPKEHRHYQTNNLDDAYEQGWNDLQECIENLPSAQPKRGKWIIMDAGFPVPKCSVCGEKAYMRKRSYYNFCPNCGADMKGNEDGAD